MKQRISIIAFFIIVLILSGLKVADNEYLAIDKKALQLPDSLTKTTQGIANYVMANFETDNEKTRAIFIWLTTNIQYDVENMFILNFYEKKEDKIKKSLETRKGICENYAILFSDICIKAGIKSFVVEGYTKQNDSVDFVPHAWCAAFVDNSWYLFDPTWASGYIHSGTFYKKINTNYFKVGPATYIKSHIPFDYLWQFLNYPVTNQEFYEGKTDQNNTKPFFSFTDSIQEFEKQNYTAQLQSTAYRIEKNGIKNSLIFDRLQYIKAELKNERKNNAINLYNTAVNDFNAGINGFNHYINYRNKQFKPQKTDAEIQTMIDTPAVKLKDAQAKIKRIELPDQQLDSMKMHLTNSIYEVSLRIQEQENWLKAYFRRGKSSRKLMFYEKKHF